MTPGARLAAAIDLVDSIRNAARENGPPADRVVNDYFRSRRYAGSKDRRAIQDLVFRVLRHGVSLGERAAKAGLAATGRSLVLIACDPAPEPTVFDATHAPAPPDRAEADALQTAREWTPDDLSRSAHLETPDWLLKRPSPPPERAMAAQLTRAPLDLRVNTLKTDREAARTALADEGVEAVALEDVPTALRVTDSASLRQSPLARDGLVEVQDANAQYACSLAAPRPGDTMVDLCAGAGGKALALAAAMANQGRLIAVDVAPNRLKTLNKRAERAGVKVAESLSVPGKGARRAQLLAPLAAQADLVVADVPCSGTGTWRRNPELRWRLTPEWLDDLAARQAALLDEAAVLVKPGGRLAYMTCSLLPEENEAAVNAFLARHTGFALTRPQETRTPDATGGDGFFVAILSRTHEDDEGGTAA